MTATPVPFTADDHGARMARAARAAADVGLAGLLAAPGPDLVWLTGYAPPADTERLTLLGRVSKVPPARRRLGRTLAALSGTPRYVQYRGDPPPCDRTHQTPPGPPYGRTTPLSKHALMRAAGQDPGPVLVVPTLEAPDAAKARGAPPLTLRDWTDGRDLCLAGRFGVRIEDMVTVTQDGGRRLNNTPRQMAIVH